MKAQTSAYLDKSRELLDEANAILRIDLYEAAGLLLRARPEINSNESVTYQNSVIPAKAGTQGLRVFGRWPPVLARGRLWAPAFAGATISY